MDSRQRYKAFISYSHRDRKTAEWLHRALETYHAPRALKARGSGDSSGALRPIFRDRAELSASADLSQVIRDALDRSEALIVLCSPSSSISQWVDQEVGYFLEKQALGRIICVIAPETPADAVLTQVLPPALQAALPEGVEPLAVDLRPDADGRRLARLKIAARLLGVGLDQLVQRDARRRLQVMAAFTTVAAVVTVAMAVMTVATLKSRQIAREQRDETEALVAYMLGDLREQLEPVGRLDVLDGVSAKVLAYYAKARTDKLDDKALAQRAKAQTLLGTIREQRGDLAGAQDAFGQAAATTHTLVERDPHNGDRIFDEAQNVFWLAYMEWKRGDVAGAESGFKHYAQLAGTLVRLDPNRPDWRIEVAYANNNLGTLLFDQDRPQEALAAFSAALAIFDAERGRAPQERKRITDTANTRAWMADTLIKLRRVREAYVQREAATTLLTQAAARDPDDKRLAAKAVATQLALGRLELDLGRLAAGRERSEAAMRRLRELAALDPTNARWGEYLLVGQLDAVDFACWSGHLADARAVHAAAVAGLAKLRTGEAAKLWKIETDGRISQQEIILARQAGDAVHAKALALKLIERLKTVSATHDTEVDRSILYGFAQLEAGQPKAAIETLSARRGALTPAGQDLLARAQLASGRRDLAEVIVKDLRKQGYAHPAFLAFWRDSPVGGILQSGGDQ